MRKRSAEKVILNLQRELVPILYVNRRPTYSTDFRYDLAPQIAGSGFYSGNMPANTATFKDFQRYVRERTRTTCEKEGIPLPVDSDDEGGPEFKTTAAKVDLDENGTPLLPEDLDLDNVKKGQVKWLQSILREFMKAHISE